MPTLAGRIEHPETPLRDLVERRINAAYNGNQTEFAKAIGESQQYVSGLLNGRITLPSREKRMKLGEELGLDQLDFFVMAGELTDDEVKRDPERLRRHPLGPDRADLVEMIERLSDAQVGVVRSLVRELAARVTEPSRQPAGAGARR